MFIYSVGLRYGCAKQSKNLKRYLLYIRKKPKTYLKTFSVKFQNKYLCLDIGFDNFILEGTKLETF